MLKSSKIQLTNFEKKKGKKERKKLERIHQFMSTVSTVSRTKVVNLDGLVARGSASFVPIHLTLSLSLSLVSLSKKKKKTEREREKGRRNKGWNMDSPRRKGIRGEGGDILTSLTRRIPQRLNPGLERGSKVGRCRGLPRPSSFSSSKNFISIA